MPLRFRAFEVLESVCFKWFGALERDGSDVGVAAVEVARQQAAARVGDAQRAVHEDFQLDVRAFLADALDLVEAEFARQDDALHAHLLPELHRGEVGRVGLHREVDGHVRPLLEQPRHIQRALPFVRRFHLRRSFCHCQ